MNKIILISLNIVFVLVILKIRILKSPTKKYYEEIQKIEVSSIDLDERYPFSSTLSKVDPSLDYLLLLNEQ